MGRAGSRSGFSGLLLLPLVFLPSSSNPSSCSKAGEEVRRGRGVDLGLERHTGGRGCCQAGTATQGHTRPAARARTRAGGEGARAAGEAGRRCRGAEERAGARRWRGHGEGAGGGARGGGRERRRGHVGCGQPGRGARGAGQQLRRRRRRPGQLRKRRR